MAKRIRLKRIRVAVVFGGRSAEHEVSLQSARSVMEALDRDRYEAVPIGISKEGRWLTEGHPMRTLWDGADQNLLPESAAAAESGALVPAAADEAPLVPHERLLAKADVLFPVLHGPYGEDGTLQGLLELAGVPYVGAGVAASALAMDKVMFKDVMIAHGIEVVPSLSFRRREWEASPAGVLDAIEKGLTYPLFVKPANLGSSVGITKCHDRESLAVGLTEAARFDRKILIELSVPHAREIEVSVLGNDQPIASVPGEIVPSREFYDYASKYLDAGEDASELLIPAPLSDEQTGEIRRLAVEAYLAIDCSGLARVDFLLNRESGDVFVNEVNTMPGFTGISMYPKLWEASGISYKELISRLIELALERHQDRQRSKTSYGV